MPLTNSQLAQALKKHSPSRDFPFPFGGYDGLVMQDGQAKPPLVELEAAWTSIAEALASKKTEFDNVKPLIVSNYQAMKDGTGTTAERAARMERALCFLARHINNLVE